MRHELISLTAVGCLIALTSVAVLSNQDYRPRGAPELVDPAAFERSCARLPRNPDELTNDSQRQAFAICRDVFLIREIVTAAEKPVHGVFDDAEKKAALRAQLVHLRDELMAVRRVLEKINLGNGDGLLIQPSSWQVDLNSDGRVAVWERYFFAIPRRKDAPMDLKTPENDAEYYRLEYALEARIRIDQSDVKWALSYHYFVESLLEMVLAYTVNQDADGYHADLYDPQAMRRAQELVLAGLRTSKLTSQLVLAEEGDLDEWIPAPHQQHSSFPIRLTEEDFRTWQLLLGHLIPLFEGKTLMVASPTMRGVLGSIAKICPAGQGVDLGALYSDPPKRIGGGEENLTYLCRSPDSVRRSSELPTFLKEYSARVDQDTASGMEMLKYLLWVN